MEIQSLGGAQTAAYQPPQSHVASGASGASTGNAQPATEAVNQTRVAPTAAAEVAKAEAQPPRPEEVRESVDKINQAIQSLARNLQFSVDEDTKMNVVKVVDTDTKDVIRQFPSEEALAIAKALDKLQGLLFKEKA